MCCKRRALQDQQKEKTNSAKKRKEFERFIPFNPQVAAIWRFKIGAREKLAEHAKVSTPTTTTSSPRPPSSSPASAMAAAQQKPAKRLGGMAEALAIAADLGFPAPPPQVRRPRLSHLPPPPRARICLAA